MNLYSGNILQSIESEIKQYINSNKGKTRFCRINQTWFIKILHYSTLSCQRIECFKRGGFGINNLILSNDVNYFYSSLHLF